MTGWPLRLVVGGVVLGGLLQGLAEAPASLLPWLLDQAQAPVRATAASGTLWSGSAELRWQGGPVPPLSLGRWAWHPAWRGLFGPGLALANNTGPMLANGMLAPGLGNLRLLALDASLPATLIPAGWATWDLLHGEGNIVLHSEALTLDHQGLTGHADLTWRDAAIAQSAVRPLGSWHLDVLANGEEGLFRIDTLGGPLHLDGQGRYALDGRYSLQGRARAEPAVQADLAPLLQTLGPTASDGSVALNIPWPVTQLKTGR